MNEKDKEKIKDLAQKSLDNKWYKIKRGANIPFILNCHFCFDLEEKRKHKKQKVGVDYCNLCYIEKLRPGFCTAIEHRNIDNIIEFLEQLAKYGELLPKTKSRMKEVLD